MKSIIIDELEYDENKYTGITINIFDGNDHSFFINMITQQNLTLIIIYLILIILYILSNYITH